MKTKTAMVAGLLAIISIACKQNNDQQPVTSNHGTDSIFPRGKKITNNNFKGTAYLEMMVDADSTNQTTLGNVTFEPGARTRWHSHPAGQILLVTEGEGYYQERGQAKRILRKGDFIKCPPNVIHWHGASINTAFVQLAITGREKGEAMWLEEVTDEDYKR